MTRDEILKMTNDELDYHVAEKITGQELARPLGENFVSHEMAMDAGDMSLEGQSMGIEWEQIEPYPCTKDIVGAWAVVNVMRERKWSPVIRGSFSTKWSCEFTNLETLDRTGSIIEDSVCVAICKAALMAISIDEEDIF